MKQRPYYTLAEWRGYPHGFAPQFGDYERATVEDERADMMRSAQDLSGARLKSLKPLFRIVRTATDAQQAIDAAIVALNERTFRAGLHASELSDGLGAMLTEINDNTGPKNG